MECLGEGFGIDELGCDDEMDYRDTKTVTYPDRTLKMTTERNGVIDKSSSSNKSAKGYRYTFPDHWMQEEDQDQVDPEQPHTQKDVAVTPTPIEWPCGGLLQTFYGTFSPPVSRGQGMLCVWTLDPEDSRPLRLDLHQLLLGSYDRLTVYNREEGKGDIIRNVRKGPVLLVSLKAFVCWCPDVSVFSQITSASNFKGIKVESHTGLMSLVYEIQLNSFGTGFKATFHVGSYCPPWEGRCGGAAGGCFTKEQRCDGKWDCPETGKDEQGCRGCSQNQFACGLSGQRSVVFSHYASRPVCYPVTERCNYQQYCDDKSDEKDCSVCQPGTFLCDSGRSVSTPYTVIKTKTSLLTCLCFCWGLRCQFLQIYDSCSI